MRITRRPANQNRVIQLADGGPESLAVSADADGGRSVTLQLTGRKGYRYEVAIPLDEWRRINAFAEDAAKRCLVPQALPVAPPPEVDPEN